MSRGAPKRRMIRIIGEHVFQEQHEEKNHDAVKGFHQQKKWAKSAGAKSGLWIASLQSVCMGKKEETMHIMSCSRCGKLFLPAGA